MGMKQRTEDGKKVYGGVLRGAAVAAVATLAGTGVVTVVENRGGIEDGVLVFAENGIRALSVFLGCLVADKKGRGVASAGLVSAAYCALLMLMTTLCFGGKFESLISGVISVAVGAISAVLLCACVSGRKTTHDARVRHRRLVQNTHTGK